MPSPITQKDYGKGRRPKNKGRKLPARPLTRDELHKLLAEFPRNTKRGSRNRAMVAVMAGAGLKVGQVVAMEFDHYDAERGEIILPTKGRTPEKRVPISGLPREALDDWLGVRSTLGLTGMAPLFPAVNKGSAGNPVHPAYIRTAVREHAIRAGIQRRVSPESLRKTYEALVDRTFDRRIHDFIDEEAFRIRHPDAYDKWRDALDFLVNPQRHATRIGHDCREALIKFTDDLVRTSGVEVAARPSDTIKKLKAVLAAKVGLSATTRDQLIAYFGMTSDLAQRQEHGAAKEGEPLTSEDARRLVYHSLLAMYEIDQVLR